MNSRLIKAAEWTVAILVSATVLFVFFTRATHAGGLWRDECDSVELARLPTFSDMIHKLFQRTPVASSFPHLVGGLFHFLLGYAVFTPIDFRGILIALFFALTFTAGHLNHEVRDFELDSKTNARTNAVAFGKRAAFIAGLIVFTLAYLCLLLLGLFRFVPLPLAFLAIVFYALHLFWSLRALRRDLDPGIVDRFQFQYRVLYAVIGIAMLCGLFFK